MLDKQDIYEIERLVKEKRNMYGFGMGPLGDNIFKLIREIGIQILYLPIETGDKQNNIFSALYIRSKEINKIIAFVGLNTYEYYDKQIFALGHELYHHYEKIDWTICRFSIDREDARECKANRFAAELLLPIETLQEEIKKVNKGEISLKSWGHLSLLRLIARLHCEYKLPYKAIVRRFREIEVIDDKQFTELIRESVRNEGDKYYLIGLNVDETTFKLLNQRTKKSGVDGPALEEFILNYEDGKISLNELSEDLATFNKTLSDFGIEEEIDIEDLEEIKDFFGS